MKKFIFTSLILLSIPAINFAQSNPLEKKLDKAYDLIKKDKNDKADDYLVELLKEYPHFGEAWDLLGEIRHQAYEDSKKTSGFLGGNFTVTVKDKNGEEKPAEDDSLAGKLVEMLNGMDISKIAYSKFMYTLRRGLLSSTDAYKCSMYPRILNIDAKVDTNVNTKALKHFSQAESAFQDKNYHKAALLYKKAIDEQPDFYKARLYLGDAYYFQGDYVEAIKRFKEAINTFPAQLEPRKYLVDAYGKEGLYEKALDVAIRAMAIYPDLSLMQKLDDAAFFNNKKVGIQWTPRSVFPVSIKSDSTSSGLNVYNSPEKLEAKDEWVYYENAADKIKEYCNEKDIINANQELN